MPRRQRIAAILAGCLLLAAGPTIAARNVILFIGDGMGLSCVTGARILKGEREGRQHPASASLFVDSFPYTALSRTYNLDQIVTESASGMTAIVTGEKTKSGYLSMVPSVDGSLRRLQTLTEIAESSGLSTGVVTTTRVTHATPAACYAHIEERGAEMRIPLFLIPGDPDYNADLGDGLDVILGGGRRQFLPDSAVDENGHPGVRNDGRDLRRELIDSGYAYVWDRAGLLRIDPARTPRLLGLFATSHMAFEDEREAAGYREPSLAEMVEAAIRVLSRDPDGFFLMVEAGRIDHALHSNMAVRALNETLALDDAVRGACQATDPEETLILVTADHELTLTIAGYPTLADGITGSGGTDRLGRPYPALLFGTGSRTEPLPPDSMSLIGAVEPAAIPLGGSTHGATDVPVFAYGETRYASRLHGVIENTALFGLLRDAIQGRR